MDRWNGRVALVTGASSGIGAAIAQELVRKGMKVVGVARRLERIEELQADLNEAPGVLYPLAGDVTKEEDILAAFAWTKENLGGVDVLVNNAGVGPLDANLAHSKTPNWTNILDVNVLALSICSREALISMQERGVDDGHIINISSIAGHKSISFPGFGMYTASKHAVKVLTESLIRELADLNSSIKVTSLSPGLVRTEMVPESLLVTHPCIESKDIADAVVFILSTPENVHVRELIIQPVGEKL